VDKNLIGSARDWYIEVIGLSTAWESDDFVLLAGKDGARLGFHAGIPLSEPDKVQIHFEVPDIDEVYARLKGQGVIFHQAPTNTSWGYRVASLHDPIGHTVELFTFLENTVSGELGA
jgi:catechol 2,3-dioxygenase-like lactoylglutathione lyase family enzyme